MDVGNDIRLSHETWSFADALDHFDEHIQQSIPNCQEQREYIASLARFFLHAGAHICEIGVSTGELAKVVLARTPERPLRYLGLDIEAEMLELARQKLAHDPRFEALEIPAQSYEFESPSLVLSYYTLQFIPLPERRELLQKIYDGLRPGGALILYEKTQGENAQIQDMLTQLYFDFKAEQGHSAQAILNKAIALRGVSMPLSLEANRQMLLQCGFQSVELIYRAYCFAGYLALKQ